MQLKDCLFDLQNDGRPCSIVEILFPDISSPKVDQNLKCRFFLFQYATTHLCAKFGDLKLTFDETRRLQVLDLPSARPIGSETSFCKDIAIFLPVSNLRRHLSCNTIDHHKQKIALQ